MQYCMLQIKIEFKLPLFLCAAFQPRSGADSEVAGSSIQNSEHWLEAQTLWSMRTPARWCPPFQILHGDEDDVNFLGRAGLHGNLLGTVVAYVHVPSFQNYYIYIGKKRINRKIRDSLLLSFTLSPQVLVRWPPPINQKPKPENQV